MLYGWKAKSESWSGHVNEAVFSGPTEPTQECSGICKNIGKDKESLKKLHWSKIKGQSIEISGK